MSAQTRGTISFLVVPLFLVPLLLVAVFGLCGVWSFLTPAEGAVSTVAPTRPASVSVPVQPNSLSVVRGRPLPRRRHLGFHHR